MDTDFTFYVAWEGSDELEVSTSMHLGWLGTCMQPNCPWLGSPAAHAAWPGKALSKRRLAVSLWGLQCSILMGQPASLPGRCLTTAGANWAGAGGAHTPSPC